MGLPLQPDLVERPRRWPWVVTCLVLLAGSLAFHLAPPATRPPPQVLLSGSGSQQYLRTVEHLLGQARRRIWVMNYVVRFEPGSPVHGLCQALAQAAHRGVEVRVVLDQGFEFGKNEPSNKNQATYDWLKAEGVPVLFDEMKRTTHAKLILIDEELAVVGSHNWTRSALFDNREASLLLHDPQAVQALATLFADVPGWPGKEGPAIPTASKP